MSERIFRAAIFPSCPSLSGSACRTLFHRLRCAQRSAGENEDRNKMCIAVMISDRFECQQIQSEGTICAFAFELSSAKIVSSHHQRDFALWAPIRFTHPSRHAYTSFFFSPVIASYPQAHFAEHHYARRTSRKALGGRVKRTDRNERARTFRK